MDELQMAVDKALERRRLVEEIQSLKTRLREQEEIDAIVGVSQPVQSPFGWHLVQVLERRTEQVSEERKKQAARQTIRGRKGDDAYQDWVRQMRDRAFVEIRLDER